MSRLHEVLEYARMLYSWVILDLPAIFRQLSMFALTEAEQAYLVATPELASLHLGRRAVGMLQQLGFDRDRFRALPLDPCFVDPARDDAKRPEQFFQQLPAARRGGSQDIAHTEIISN